MYEICTLHISYNLYRWIYQCMYRAFATFIFRRKNSQDIAYFIHEKMRLLIHWLYINKFVTLSYNLYDVYILVQSFLCRLKWFRTKKKNLSWKSRTNQKRYLYFNLVSLRKSERRELNKKFLMYIPSNPTYFNS